jgi:hypothetical protein
MEQYIKASTLEVRDQLEASGALPLEDPNIGAAFGKVCADFTYDKDREDVYDDLLWLLIHVIAASGRPLNEIMLRVGEGRLKAHAKHGDNSIEAKSGDDTLFWIACLGEEYGEACEVVDDYPRYLEECVDLATVATAWISALGRLD